MFFKNVLKLAYKNDYNYKILLLRLVCRLPMCKVGKMNGYSSING